MMVFQDLYSVCPQNDYKLFTFVLCFKRKNKTQRNKTKQINIFLLPGHVFDSFGAYINKFIKTCFSAKTK